MLGIIGRTIWFMGKRERGEAIVINKVGHKTREREKEEKVSTYGCYTDIRCCDLPPTLA